MWASLRLPVSEMAELHGASSYEESSFGQILQALCMFLNNNRSHVMSRFETLQNIHLSRYRGEILILNLLTGPQKGEDPVKF